MGGELEKEGGGVTDESQREPAMLMEAGETFPEKNPAAVGLLVPECWVSKLVGKIPGERLSTPFPRFPPALTYMKGVPQGAKQSAVRGKNAPVGVKRDSTSPQKREQVGLAVARDRVILALIHARLDKAVALADVHDPLDLLGRVVADAEPLKLALPEGVVHRRARDLERRLAIGCMQVQNVHFGRAQRRERALHAGFDPRFAVRARREGCHFGVNRGPGVDVERAEQGFRGPCRTDGIGARRVYLGVLARAEEVEDRVCCFGGVIFGMWVGRGAKGSGPEDDFGVGGGRRHLSCQRDERSIGSSAVTKSLASLYPKI